MALASILRERRTELIRFAVVGGVAFGVDLGLFNLLLYYTDTRVAEEGKVVTAKVISALVATVVAWIGNRAWTFSDKRVHTPAREFVWFAIINAVALGIAAGVVAFSTYVLDLTSQFETNAAAIVGIGLGTIARYVGYRQFVFTGDRSAGAP